MAFSDGRRRLTDTRARRRLGASAKRKRASLVGVLSEVYVDLRTDVGEADVEPLLFLGFFLLGRFLGRPWRRGRRGSGRRLLRSGANRRRSRRRWLGRPWGDLLLWRDMCPVGQALVNARAVHFQREVIGFNRHLELELR